MLIVEKESANDAPNIPVFIKKLQNVTVKEVFPRDPRGLSRREAYMLSFSEGRPTVSKLPGARNASSCGALDAQWTRN